MTASGSPGRVVILGAGPTGLGAAWRLLESGHELFDVYEMAATPGGLASSFLDDRGFTWDLGGHVLFSHYDTFDAVMDLLLGDQWVRHQREAWVWMRERFIPYPFQNNLHRLPPDERLRCLEGLVEVLQRNEEHRRPENFEDWLLATFGPGLAQLFMIPYNSKVWAWPLSRLGRDWIGERVAEPDLKRILRNLVFDTDDVSWGPNDTFRFPLKGGTGAIWRALAGRLPADRLHFEREATALDTRRRRVRFAGGEETAFDTLVSTLPLDRLLAMSDLLELAPAAQELLHSSTHAVGVGMRGRTPAALATKCWMYFPESNCPFYRVTAFSNYSPNNTPPGEFWSLMAEVSSSAERPVASGAVVDDVLRGLRATGLLPDGAELVSTFHLHAEYGYPTPFLGRDRIVEPILRALAERGIYSRGRFGAWKYEVSNQDHSFMQGVECADHLLRGVDETTVWRPAQVNSRQPRPIGGRGSAGKGVQT